MELSDLIADAAGGLSDRDRAVLELAFRHGLNGPYLAEALGVSASNANTIVHRLRETIQRSLGALLVSRRVRSTGGCAELAGILDRWDGHFNVLMRKRISRHIESCDSCDEERRRLVSPVALLGATPVFVPAPAWLRERTLNGIELTSASTAKADNAVHAAVFDLAFRHGLSGPELADALGVSHTNANTMVQRLRQTVERALGALLVCRRQNASGSCEGLNQLLAGWDGQFTVLMRKRVSRHIESCAVCDGERRRLVSPAALLAAAPAFIPAPQWLRERTIGDIQLICHTSDMTSGTPNGDAGATEPAGRRRVLVAVALIIALGATAALLLVWLNREPASILPTDIGEKSPTSQTTQPSAAPTTQTTAPIPTPEPVLPVPPADTPQLIPFEPPPSSESEPSPRLTAPPQTRLTPVTRNPSSYAPAPNPIDPAVPTGGGNDPRDSGGRVAGSGP